MGKDDPAFGSAPLALVTGASSGIGRSVAVLLARRGYRTLLIARRAEKLQTLARELSAFATSVAAPMDLSEPDAPDRFLPPLLASHGAPHVLVNNAGYGLYRPFVEHTPADHHRLMQVNYFAALSIIRIALPGMIRRGSGHVINIASMSTKIGPWGHAGYAASKAALVCATQTLAAEHAGDGIHFSYVNPGIVSTPYFECGTFAPLYKRVAHRAVSPDLAAQRIVGLIDRPRLELCIPRHYRLLDWLYALSPRLAHQIVARHSRPLPDTAAADSLAPEPEQRKG